MLVDTHCHINMMVKKEFDVSLSAEDFLNATTIVMQAEKYDVSCIINVGTSLVESLNCVELAQKNNNIYAAVGIHPNDATEHWHKELKQLTALLKEQNKIVAIGECGLDRHYKDYNLPRQKDAFKAQIEVALEHDLALIVHTRDAYDETLKSLDEFRGQGLRGTIHCFSEDQAFADYAIELGFVIGIGGTITYPKNNLLRSVAATTPLEKIILETDAPFLAPQAVRGQQNHPKNIAIIAEFLADLRRETMQTVAAVTTETALNIFRIKEQY